MTLDLTQLQDARIAEYSFGRTISSHGVNVFSSTDARLGKRIFGNDPDPLQEVVVDNHTEQIQQWIADHPGGPVDQAQETIFDIDHNLQLHHRSLMFGSTWKSDSLVPAGKSLIYHAGAWTNFRVPGLARLTSKDEHGVCCCSGFENRAVKNRKFHRVENEINFTPTSVGSILIPLFDGFYHKTKLRQHFPFLVSEPDTIILSLDQPGVVMEITTEEVDQVKMLDDWLSQVEEGLIEIVDRV